jgi:tetratricopeptide (TPR) repeat protein
MEKNKLKEDRIFFEGFCLRIRRTYIEGKGPTRDLALLCNDILNHRFISVLIVAISMTVSPFIGFAQSPVSVSEADENIPTYMSGPPDPNPMFFFGRGTQGAEQRIYPYPLYDNLTNKKGDKTYHLIYLENEYVKISVLPELGGRLFSAVDKTNNYNFIYPQHVIKPALIGLTGAWISGGVEWNIPHHHRASTFIPVQYSIEEGADGSKTIWVGELEIRHRMRWAVGYTLRPGSSIVECNVRIINRTPVENTMLCFANIAVSINNDYQVIFPPSTQWSTGHSKRNFNPWPLVDGVDVSWYKNNKTPNSWFAVNYDDDFVAGYDHGKNAGILNIADHHIVAGKKFFTWGVGNMWDKILTDNDGPYLEIMVGAYSDNQPDYSWLQPNEERSFVMSLFPFRGIDGVKNANLDAAVNFDVKEGKAIYGFYTTKAYSDATVTLRAGDRILSEEHISINPGKPYSKHVNLPKGQNEHELRASIFADGRELVSYSPLVLQPMPKPVSYTEPKEPAQIKNNEELFLAGQRIDQFHNPTLDADPYWEEALRRDSGNIAANTGMGRLCLRNAKYVLAEKYFNKAIERLTAQYTTSKDVEPIYYLGVALKAQGRLDDAYTAFYKATWKQEWKAPAYYALAEIASSQGKYSIALDHVNHALDANAFNVRAYVLKAGLLRHLNRREEAQKLIVFAKDKCDPLDAQLMAEQWLAIKDATTSKALFTTLIKHSINAEEIASGYYNNGLFNDGVTILSELITQTKDKSSISPLVYYYLGYFAEKLGDSPKALEYRKQASLQPLDYVFPFQQEMINVLRSAIKANPMDARAPYYLGNLLYDWQPEEAIVLWEKSSVLDPGNSIVWRNLAIAYSHQASEGSKSKAIACFEKAISVPNPCPTHFAELDQLYKSEGTLVEKRLAVLEKNQKVVVKKDESLGALINLEIFAGKTDEAIVLLQGRTFSIWEGPNAFNTGQAWADAHLIRGLNYLRKKQFQKALNDLQSALNPPDNLRAEGQNSRLTQIKYWIGCAFDALGQKENAIQLWKEVAASDTLKNLPRIMPGFGNRQVQRYFVAMAQQKLDPKADVKTTYNELSNRDKNMIVKDSGDKDYQFISAKKFFSLDDKAFPHYLSGLGYIGLGDKIKARQEFKAALQISPDFLSAKIELDQL